MNFIGNGKTKCTFNGNVTNNIDQNLKVSSNTNINNYESMSNNGDSSLQSLTLVQSPQTTSNTNNNNNNNRQMYFENINSSVEFTGDVFNGCQIEKVIIINTNDNTNDN
eukprot:125363_1